MNVRRYIADHPLPPVLVPLPLLAVGTVLLCDVAFAFTGSPRWFAWSRPAVIAAATLELLALLARGADYFGRRMNQRGARLAAVQLMVDLVAVGLFAIGALLRGRGPAADEFPLAALTMVLALVLWSLALALAQKTDDEFPVRFDGREDAASFQGI